MSRKTRYDALLKGLPRETRDRIVLICAEAGLVGAVSQVRKLTGFTSGVSVSSLQRFCAWHRVESAVEANRDDALAFEDLLKDRPDLNLDADRARTVAQLHFERRVIASDDPELYFAWMKERRAEDALRLDREKYALERDKFERLVLAKLDDLLAARSAADKAGLKGDDQVAAVRKVLWGAQAA
jgi:hypothetical protein